MSKRYLYAKLIEALLADIKAGRFSVGARFPSEQRLASRFGVARGTVRQAIEHLKKEGIVRANAGSGTYLSVIPEQRTIAIIAPHVINGEFSPPICAAIRKAAEKEGFSTLFKDASSFDERTRISRAFDLVRSCLENHVAGAIIEPIERISDAPGPESSHQIVRALAQAGIPITLLDRDIVPPPERSGYDLVGIDNAQIGYRLARHLIERGARRICCLFIPRSAPSVILRMQGAREAMLDAGLPCESNNVRYVDPANASAVAAVVRSKTPPDAFLCGNDLTAAALLKTLSRLGVKCPRDVMVTGVNDIKAARMAHPKLTTIHMPCEQIALTCVQTLLQRIKDPSLPPRQILLDAPLVTRASTRRPDLPFASRRQQEGCGR